MSGPANNPEKAPKKEDLKKIPKRKIKCLGCTDGLIYNGKGVRICKGCRGKGFIYV